MALLWQLHRTLETYAVTMQSLALGDPHPRLLRVGWRLLEPTLAHWSHCEGYYAHWMNKCHYVGQSVLDVCDVHLLLFQRPRPHCTSQCSIQHILQLVAIHWVPYGWLPPEAALAVATTAAASLKLATGLAIAAASAVVVVVATVAASVETVAAFALVSAECWIARNRNLEHTCHPFDSQGVAARDASRGRVYRGTHHYLEEGSSCAWKRSIWTPHFALEMLPRELDKRMPRKEAQWGAADRIGVVALADRWTSQIAQIPAMQVSRVLRRMVCAVCAYCWQFEVEKFVFQRLQMGEKEEEETWKDRFDRG